MDGTGNVKSPDGLEFGIAVEPDFSWSYLEQSCQATLVLKALNDNFENSYPNKKLTFSIIFS